MFNDLKNGILNSPVGAVGSGIYNTIAGATGMSKLNKTNPNQSTTRQLNYGGQRYDIVGTQADVNKAKGYLDYQNRMMGVANDADTGGDTRLSRTLDDGGAGAAAAAEAAGRASALSEIDRILGNIGTKRDQGLSRLGASYGDAEARLNRDRQLAMEGYQEQRGVNEKDKLRGTEQVDQFANNSYSNLRRLLLGGNAGSSSVMRELVPQLVSKAAGQRRQGVFDTYGENEVGIDKAQTAATRQFDESGEDLRNQRRNAEESFTRSILEQEQDLIRQKQGLGGLDLGTANAQIAQRDAQLNNLFSQFAPQFSAKTVSAEKPELGKYTIDQAAVRQGQGQYPSETAYYLPALRKKQQGQL